MNPRALLLLYVHHLRAHPLREALAGLGVAVGVALVFSVQAANQSVARSAEQIIHALAGSAQLQVESRAPDGMPESVARFAQLPGVAAAANVVEANVTVMHGRRVLTGQLLGAGVAAGTVNSIAAAVPPANNGVLLPASAARSLGVARGASVMLLARGYATRARVQAVLGPETIGSLASSEIVLASLPYAQSALGIPGRVTNTLIVTRPGMESVARAALTRATGNRAAVGSATAEDGLLRRALAPQDETTSFFTLVGALVGTLLVGTAVLLRAVEWRQTLSDLRCQGYRPRTLRKIALTHALILGVLASTVGVGVGYLLAVYVWQSNPAYLAGAFPLGTQTSIPAVLLVEVWCGGVLLACAAGAMGLATSSPRRGSPGFSARVCTVMLLGAVALSIAPMPSPLVAALALVLAVLLAIPACWGALVHIAGKTRVKALLLAAHSARSAPVRSFALVATVAIGVFGAVTAQTAHSDLLHGLEHGYAAYVRSARIWVTDAHDDLATNPISSEPLQREIRQQPDVQEVRAYYGGWLTLAGHRVWLIGRSAPNNSLPPGQITGDRVLAERRLREGGWVALSSALAKELHARIGARVEIPTPTGPVMFGVAALTTNLGWSSGVLFLGAGEYTRYWGSTPTALEIEAPESLLPTIHRLLPPGLVAVTSAGRAGAADALPRQGLQRLSEIALLLLIAAALSTAATMGAAVWRARETLASLRLQGFKPSRILLILAWEALLVMIVGVTIGAASGVYGHLLADQYLQHSTGYPVVFAFGAKQVAGAMAVVVAAVLVVLAAPGFIASRASPKLALDGS